MNTLQRLILQHVRAQPESTVNGQIEIQGFEEQDVLEATSWLVANGHLTGAFPTNPNSPWRRGYEWGYVYAQTG
jgi:hypothetical protein